MTWETLADPGAANTDQPDPNPPNCFDSSCFVMHAYEWHADHLTDLGSLPSGASSWTNAINHRGLVPTTGFIAFKPTVWYRGQIIDIGTLGGYSGTDNSGSVLSLGSAVVPRFAPSAVGFWSEDGPFVGPFHAVLWDHGQTITLGTIEGDDNSNAFDINAQGRVVGQTWYFNGMTTDSSHAFVWQRERQPPNHLRLRFFFQI